MINNDNKIVEIQTINLQSNEIVIDLKADKYAKKRDMLCLQIPNMYDLTFEQLKAIIEVEMKTYKDEEGNNLYSDYVDIWHEPTWNYRFYVTNEQIAFLTANYFQLVASLYTEPINPKVTLSEGILVYANSIEPTAVPLFESMNIIIETK